MFAVTDIQRWKKNSKVKRDIPGHCGVMIGTFSVERNEKINIK